MNKFLLAGTLLLWAHAAHAQDAVTQDPIPSPPPAHTDPVVVRSTPLGGELFEQTQPVAILSGDELKLRLEPTIGETLNREPGVSSTYFGPGASRPVIRGLGEDRVRVLQDGLATIDASDVSPDHAVAIEPLTIESIEVVRGPATLLYGPNTVGGAVNVIDNRIPSEKLSRPIEGRVEGRLGTADEQRSGAGVVEFGLGPIVVHLDGFKRRTEDIEIPGFARSERLREMQPLPPGEAEPRDTLPNSFTESEGGAGGVSYVWEKGYAGVSYSGIDSTYGTVAEPNVAIGLEQRRWDFRGAFQQPFEPIKSITYKFGYSDYTHTEFEGPAVGTVFTNEGYDGRIEVAHEKLGPFEGVFGYQTQKTNFSALGEEAFLPPVESETQAGFVFEEIALDPVRLQFGARFDHQMHQSETNLAFGPGLSREFNAFSGSAGLAYTPVENYVIALSLSYTQRPPTYVELFANGPHLATNAFEIGDPDLGLEESFGLDLSFRKKVGRVTGAVSLFYNHFDNFIKVGPTGAIEDDLPVFVFAATNADFLGGEVSLDWHLIEPAAAEDPSSAKDGKEVATPGRPGNPHSLHLETKADYVYAQDRETDRSLPRITPFRTSAALVYAWRDRFGARLEGQYAHEQDRTADFELRTDGYFLLNASVNYRIAAGPVEIDVYLKGTNLTNEEARFHTSFLKDIAPLAGRGVLLGVRTTF
ncbi:MAG TPA: TonB-dependent receptor [Chthoniobacterales bacterium]|nr:TonB-dependent receptor [Chthoniobacterales bacterium]